MWTIKPDKQNYSVNSLHFNFQPTTFPPSLHPYVCSYYCIWDFLHHIFYYHYNNEHYNENTSLDTPCISHTCSVYCLVSKVNIHWMQFSIKELYKFSQMHPLQNVLTWVVEGRLCRVKIRWLMYSMLPNSAHLAASLDFSPQFTPSAINMMQLLPRAQIANASATGSPERPQNMASWWILQTTNTKMCFWNTELLTGLQVFKSCMRLK